MRRTFVLPRLGAALAVAGLGAAAMSGCSFSARTGVSVSKTDLQKEISQKLEAAGQKPQSVTCKDDLQGEVGKSTRCEVVIDSSSSFDLLVNATKVEGTTVSYEMTPSESKAQLERDVAKMLADPSVTIDSVSCEGGLDGKVGAETRCDVTAAGSTATRTVAVTRVEGLMMYFKVLPMLGKDRKSTRLNSSHIQKSRMPSSA